MPKKNSTTQKSNLSFPSLSREELGTLLSDLYEKFEDVKNFIDLRMTGNCEPMFKKYKKLIEARLGEDIGQ